MKLLHFVMRDTWEFVTHDEYYLCPDTDSLELTTRQLVEAYGVDKPQPGMFTSTEIEGTALPKQIFLTHVDLKKE